MGEGTDWAFPSQATHRRVPTNGDAFLAGAVVIRVVSDADLPRRLDDSRDKRIARLRVGHAQQALLMRRRGGAN